MMRKTGTLLIATLCVVLLTGCDESDTIIQEGDTIIVGTDCGLIRNDLIGDWEVAFENGSTTLLNCDDPASDGGTVDVVSTPVTYADVGVIASPSSTSFVVFSEGPSGLVDELIGSVEADSCLTLVQLWENDDGAWLECIGTFERSTGLISASCDSAALETSGDRVPDVACDLAGSLLVEIAVF